MALKLLSSLFGFGSKTSRNVGKMFKSNVPTAPHILQSRVSTSPFKRLFSPPHRVLHDIWDKTDAYWPSDKALVKMHPRSGRLGRLSKHGKWEPPRRHDTFFMNPGDRVAQRFMIDEDMLNIKMSNVGRPFLAQSKKLQKHVGKDVFSKMRVGVEKGSNHKDFVNWYGKLSPDKQSAINTWMGNWRNISATLHKRGSIGVAEWEGARGLGKVDGMVFSSIPSDKFFPHAKANIYTIHMPGNFNKIIGRNMNADDIVNHGLWIDPVHGGFSSQAEAYKYIRDNNYLGKAIIFPDGHVPGKFKFATKNRFVAEHLVDRATTRTYGSQYDTALIDQVRNVATKAMKDGMKLESKDMILDVMKAKLGDKVFFDMIKNLGGGTKGQDRLIRAFKGEEWIAKTHKNIKSVHMTKRTGVMAERNVQVNYDDIEEYINTTFRKVYMQPSIDYVKALRESPILSKNLDNARYMDDLVDKVLGVPSANYRWLRQVLSPVISKKQLDQGIRNIIQAQAALKIGLNPLMPLVNATQLHINTGAALGFQYPLKAYKFGQTRIGRKLIRRAGYTIKYEGADVAKLAEGLDGLGTAGIMDKINSYVLKPFQIAEVRHNRAYSYLAGFLHGKDVMKIKGFHALDEYAKSIVDLTQFSYGSASQPKIFGSLSRVPLQFKSYFIKQVDFTDKLARLALRGVRENRPELTYPFLRLMGSYGAIGGVSSVPFISYFQERSAKMNELALKYPVLFRGLPSITGVDFTRRLSVGFPATPDDFFTWAIGPALGDLMNLAKASPELMRGRAGQKTMMFIRGLSPVSSAFFKVDKDGKGWKSVDSSGRTIARFGGAGEAILHAVGFRTTKSYNQEVKHTIMRLYQAKLRSERSYYLNKLAQARLDGNVSEYQKLLQDSKKILIGDVLRLGISGSDVTATLKRGQKQLSDRGISKEVKNQLQQHGNLPISMQ